MHEFQELSSSLSTLIVPALQTLCCKDPGHKFESKFWQTKSKNPTVLPTVERVEIAVSRFECACMYVIDQLFPNIRKLYLVLSPTSFDELLMSRLAAHVRNTLEVLTVQMRRSHHNSTECTQLTTVIKTISLNRFSKSTTKFNLNSIQILIY
jgi:hypothetical protein